ncbi:MAG TPA: restriction endonuclease subunit S [Flavobacterium sp.]|nr:restriction endonuclease subunit S [Flavobacterium sp.]
MKEDWIECEVGDLLKLKNGYAFKSTNYKSEGIPVLRIGDIQDWNVDVANAKRTAENEEYDSHIVYKGDILIAMSGATTGKFGIYNSEEKAYQNQRVGNLIPHSEIFTNKKYIYFLLYSLKRDIEIGAYGGAQPNISSTKIEALKTKLFPLPTQKAIVKKIEELFSSLDSGIVDLKKAQDQLVIYRQAVLKKAFEGGFTKEWRKKNKIKFDWKEVILNEICEHITDGDHQAPPKADDGIPFITISNINKSTKVVDFSNTYFVGIDYYLRLNEKRTPKKGDVLYTVTGSFGIPVLVNFEKQFCFQRHIGLLRPNVNLINQKWLFLVLQSQSVYKQAYEKATGTAQKTVALSTLRNITVLLCSLKEQHQIVQEIESRLSVCDKVEESITESLEKAQALRQSILKKAFEGKLLSKAEIAKCKADKDYEPASVLLEKIKAEKKKK